LATDGTELLVLRDDAGQLYAINRARLEEFRIPAALTATVEQALAPPEVTGYSGTAVPIVAFTWGQLPASSATQLSDITKVFPKAAR
jgi:hypothetical protein